jgi:hypothetical protein
MNIAEVTENIVDNSCMRKNENSIPTIISGLDFSELCIRRILTLSAVFVFMCCQKINEA